MAREGLPLELASALRQAAGQDTEVVREGVQIRTHPYPDNTTNITHVNLSVLKLKEPESVRGLLLVSFRPCLTPLASNPHKGVPRSKRETTLVAELEHELQNAKESLQSTIEELQTANEELKSTNEELQSTNEELQSTNEEMETSKEEMQSLNEELNTVNAEMQSKVEDMSRTNDDMQNLLNSTEVATIFLDGKLNIKRYTEQARVLISLIPTDIGRPLAHLASSLAYSTLVQDCREVLRTLVFKLAEVHTQDGHWYLMRIMPYRTAENVIDGVVITLVDINPVKLAEKSLLRMSKVFLNGPEPILLLDLKGVILALNDEAESAFGWSRQEMLGKSYQMITPDAVKPTAQNALQKSLTGAVVRDVACTFVTKAGRELAGTLTLKVLTDDSGQSDAICFHVRQSTS
jgi:two-component system CheB/CheR fusion protein